MSLLSAARVADNQIIRDRVTAAIRQTAAARYDDTGVSGQLARVCLLDPSIALQHMLVRIAADSTLTSNACPSCGFAWVNDAGQPIDDAIRYVVDSQWDAVAVIVYPVA